MSAYPPTPLLLTYPGGIQRAVDSIRPSARLISRRQSSRLPKEKNVNASSAELLDAVSAAEDEPHVAITFSHKNLPRLFGGGVLDVDDDDAPAPREEG